MAPTHHWFYEVPAGAGTTLNFKLSRDHRVFCSVATRDYGLMYPRDEGIAQGLFMPLASAQLASEIDAVRPYRSGS
jgi:hypothetical protein